MYLKDKSKRKFENQANALTTLLSLTPKQRPEVLDLISNNGLRQDSIKKELKVAKALKDNKVVKKLMTAMTNQAITFDTSLVNLLTPQQTEIFVKDRIDKKLKGKLKRFQVEQKITDSDLLAIKELMIEHQYKKSTLIKANQNRIISDAETKTLDMKVQKLLTAEQFAEYQKKFAK